MEGELAGSKTKDGLSPPSSIRFYGRLPFRRARATRRFPDTLPVPKIRHRSNRNREGQPPLRRHPVRGQVSRDQRIRQAEIAALAGHENVPGLQRAPNALLRLRRGINRMMKKPSPVIIPEVMIGIGRETGVGGGRIGFHGERKHCRRCRRKNARRARRPPNRSA